MRASKEWHFPCCLLFTKQKMQKGNKGSFRHLKAAKQESLHDCELVGRACRTVS